MNLKTTTHHETPSDSADESRVDPLHFIVLSNPRSGSGLFCSLLENTDLLGHPKRGGKNEVLHPNRPTGPGTVDWNNQDVKAFLQDVLDEHGWFKLHWYQFANMIRHARRGLCQPELSIWHFASHIPSSTPLVLIIRKDKLAQSVSAIKSMITNEWKRKQGQSSSEQEPPKPKVSLYTICYHIEDGKRSDGFWRRFLSENQLEFFECSYEELVKDKSKVISEALQFMEVEVPVALTVDTDRVKLADTFNQTLVKKYQQSNKLYRGFCHWLARLSIGLKQWRLGRLG